MLRAKPRRSCGRVLHEDSSGPGVERSRGSWRLGPLGGVSFWPRPPRGGYDLFRHCLGVSSRRFVGNMDSWSSCAKAVALISHRPVPHRSVVLLALQFIFEESRLMRKFEARSTMYHEVCRRWHAQAMELLGNNGEDLHTRSRPTSTKIAHDENDDHVFPSVTNTFTRCWPREHDSQRFGVVLNTKFVRYHEYCSCCAFSFCSAKIDPASHETSFSSEMRHVLL